MVQSDYAQTRRALQLASVVVALGQGESKAIEEGFLIDGAKVRDARTRLGAPSDLGARRRAVGRMLYSVDHQ